MVFTDRKYHFYTLGKPKMFFIQACQGDQLDGGVHLKKVANTETDSNAMSYKVNYCYIYSISISKHINRKIVSTVSLNDRKYIFRFHHMQIFLLYIQQFLGFIPGEIPLPVSNVMKFRHISNIISMSFN